MSRIDDLIAEQCPNGVPYMRVGDIASVGTGKSDRKDACEGGDYPFYVRSKYALRRDSYEFDEEAILIPGEGGIGEIFHYVDGKYALHQRAYRISFNLEQLDTKFAFYYFMTSFKQFILKKAVSATVTSIRKPMITDFQVPVPPVEVQREIVRILDHFTQLEAELEAELEARRRQYEHYRHGLLALSASDGTRWTTLGDISRKVSSGGTPSSGREAYYGGEIPWLRTQEVDFGLINSTGMTITEEGLGNSSAKWIPAHCVIVAMYGATAAKVAINEIPLTTNQACCNLQIDPSQAEYRYVFHWVANEYERLKGLGEGSQSNLNAQKVKNYPIRLPSLEGQHKIIEILDRFDALANDLSVGLPAELNARRKQYGHYRDRLLTFEEAAA